MTKPCWRSFRTWPWHMSRSRPDQS